VNEPQINADHFGQQARLPRGGAANREAGDPRHLQRTRIGGVDVAAVEILCGERGAAILDEHGRCCGLRGRIVRALQWPGYDETTLAIYDKALRDGDLLLRVPARPAERRGIAALLQRHHVHDVGYFGPGTLGQFPALDAG
jgi:hypothetical protein